MATIGMHVDLSALVNEIIAGNSTRVAAVARELLRQGAHASELIGRVGMIAAHGDKEGHTILMLSAASVLSHWIHSLPPMEEGESYEREVPLLVQALLAAAPAIRVGKDAKDTYPKPFFPSELKEGQTVSEVMHNAVDGNDALTVERLLFGLYGTGADYRTTEIRTYDGISTTFQDGGHPLMFAVRGFQLLEAAECGDKTPNILHWLAPHLPLHSEEAAWVKEVRAFTADRAHSVESLRVRLAAPKDASALAVRKLVLSNADTTQVCQGVYDALMRDGASTPAIGSLIALAASDLMQRVDDENREAFIQTAHGLLFSAAVRLVFAHVQDLDAVPLLFTSAACINALHKELATNTPQTPARASFGLGGGLIAPSLLETLKEQLNTQDVHGAMATASRYLKLNYDRRALFASIAQAAAQTDVGAEQGHTWQIIQAAGEEYMAWPRTLSDVNIDGFVRVALRAAAFAKRNTLLAHL